MHVIARVRVFLSTHSALTFVFRFYFSSVAQIPNDTTMWPRVPGMPKPAPRKCLIAYAPKDNVIPTFQKKKNPSSCLTSSWCEKDATEGGRNVCVCVCCLAASSSVAFLPPYDLFVRSLVYNCRLCVASAYVTDGPCSILRALESAVCITHISVRNIVVCMYVYSSMRAHSSMRTHNLHASILGYVCLSSKLGTVSVVI